jgi:O-antigen/teichoic acid export membrane protein
VQHTLATGRAATLIKLAFAAGAKLSAAFIAFGLTALVTRNMPNDEAGLFLLGFSILAVLSVFFRLGLDNVILRFLSAHGTDAFAQEKLNRGLLWVATVVIPSTVLGMFFSEQIATHIFNKPAFGPVLFWMLLALPAMAIFMLLAMAFQAQHRVVITTIFQNLGISTIFVAAFGYLWVEQPEVLNAVTAAQIYAGAAGIILLAALITWFSQKGISFNVTSYKDKELTSASANLWVATSMQLITVWSGILIAGAIVPAEELAQLSAAQRTAMLTSFVIMVVNMVVAPRYAQMWNNDDMNGIQRLAKWSTRSMIAIVAPIILVMVLLPERVMSLFGEGYEQAAFLLSIMAVGQFINVATGSVGYLLNMSGHEKDFRRVTLFVGPLTIGFALFGIPFLGVVGAALATALGVGLQNIIAMYLVKRRLGFFPLSL